MHKKGKDGGAQSDDGGAKSGSNASERCEVEFSEREEAHAPSGEVGAQSPSNAVGGARPDKANPPFQFGLLLLCVEKAGDVFITKGNLALGEFSFLYDIRKGAERIWVAVGPILAQTSARCMQRKFDHFPPTIAATAW